jgi:hypothetical protein
VNEKEVFTIRVPFIGRVLCWLGWHRENAHELDAREGTTRKTHLCARCDACRISVHCWADDRY